MHVPQAVHRQGDCAHADTQGSVIGDRGVAWLGSSSVPMSKATEALDAGLARVLHGVMKPVNFLK